MTIHKNGTVSANHHNDELYTTIDYSNKEFGGSMMHDGGVK